MHDNNNTPDEEPEAPVPWTAKGADLFDANGNRVASVAFRKHAEEIAEAIAEAMNVLYLCDCDEDECACDLDDEDDDEDVDTVFIGSPVRIIESTTIGDLVGENGILTAVDANDNTYPFLVALRDGQLAWVNDIEPASKPDDRLRVYQDIHCIPPDAQYIRDSRGAVARRSSTGSGWWWWRAPDGRRFSGVDLDLPGHNLFGAMEPFYVVDPELEDDD